MTVPIGISRIRRVGVAEVADVDEQDHIAEVGHLRERRDDVVLRAARPRYPVMFGSRPAS
jgi:hypothetical protein